MKKERLKYKVLQSFTMHQDGKVETISIGTEIEMPVAQVAGLNATGKFLELIPGQEENEPEPEVPGPEEIK